jgi:hypothetical protein
MVFPYVFLTILISTRIAGFASSESLEKPASRESDSGKGQEFQGDDDSACDDGSTMEATCGAIGRTRSARRVRHAKAGA